MLATPSADATVGGFSIAFVATPVLEQPKREILAVVDRDATVVVREREASARPGSSVVSRVEQRIQRTRIDAIRQWSKRTGFTAFNGAHRVYDGRADRFLRPDFVLHGSRSCYTSESSDVFHPNRQTILKLANSRITGPE